MNKTPKKICVNVSRIQQIFSPDPSAVRSEQISTAKTGYLSASESIVSRNT